VTADSKHVSVVFVQSIARASTAGRACIDSVQVLSWQQFCNVTYWPVPIELR
jgi:hypothetical protein